MIQLDNVAKTYGARTLFQDLSWQLYPGRKIGLIGPNGAGKTTLFRILSGQIEADAGRVVLPKSATVGLLPQEVGDLGDGEALAFVLEGRADLLHMERRLAVLRSRIETAAAKEQETLSHELGEVESRYAVLGGYELRPSAERILAGMGFTQDEMRTPIPTLSGGMRVRLLLCRLLLQRPTVLLMDEPTNHLDVPSVEWLESFLQDYEGTVVVISHDRYFLNKLVNETAAIDVDGFHITPGGYDAYEAARAERFEQLEREAAQQERKIKETERFIERFRYKATKSRQVQSRVKQLAKIDRIETATERKSITFRFPDAGRSGKDVVVADELWKSYGDHEVLRDVDLTLHRGDKVAVVGPNGAGKSTLLRLIADELEPTAGEVRVGHNVVTGYFAQHQVDALKLDRTVLEEMEGAASVDTAPLCRHILGAFLFSGDEVHKHIQVLSGGERSRVALAKMLLRETNLLLLDEPTNHLDITSRDVLIDAMQQYPGTIVFVSHDRHFINAVATRVVHVEGGGVEDYRGDYEYYAFKRKQEREAVADAGSDDESAGGARESKKERRRREAELRKALQAKTGKLRKKLEHIEEEIASTEARSEEVETALQDPGLYTDSSRAGEIRELTQERDALGTQLEALYHEWAPLAEAIEEGEAEVRAEFAADD